MVKNTRDALLLHAEILFSAKGFYGVSINDVAKQINVSKQGLLHHFATKEKLYAEVLRGAADHLMNTIEAIKQAHPVEIQLNKLFRLMSVAEGRLLRVIVLLMRELLDNEQRADTAKQWFLRPIIDELVAIAQNSHQQLDTQYEQYSALAHIYVLLGATQYYVVSLPTLKRLYSSAEFSSHREQHLATIDALCVPTKLRVRL